MKNKLLISNLLISQFLTAVFLYFAYYYWFSSGLSELFDFSHTAKLLALGNLVLGPLLILLVYKKNKKGLKSDLMILAIVQIAVFLFGSYSLYKKHPTYAVFTIDRFTLVDANSASNKKIKFDELRFTPLSKTRLVYAKQPDNALVRKSILWGVLLDGQPDLDGRPEHYRPYNNYINKVLVNSIDSSEILKKAHNRNQLETFLSKYGGNSDSYAYLPLQHNDRDVIWVLDKITAQPVGILNVDPWQFKRPKVKTTKTKKPFKGWLI